MKALLIVVVLVALGASSLYFYRKMDVPSTDDLKTDVAPTSIKIDNVDIKATFKIITNGTTRIFTDSKYHNQSSDVYIEKADPNIINVKGVDITWDDFFKTLPMSLDKKCLVTGTKQTFCTQDEKVLKFKINNTENINALDEVIKDNDYLLVEYK